ncbi:T9SS type A sorting domain-containing protein [Neolewinella aurantiaca]|uniref:T9SS type A sorting domain-containing protein n=1 Tax=Neolewinella aurantiaca TaxID=2602767 RepID=A0A5C7FV95_9BACT|nr:T9SS type A sorting domain-containing protein [Neolewinella aurantiaca]TXF89452.1 T9SS type A sorting domain-containing protein [Neolewinella aurantiaca]
MNIPTSLWRTPGIVILVLMLLPLTGQNAEFFVEDLTAESGGQISVNVRANGMSELVGIQFSLSWDTEVLEYVDVSNIVLNGAIDENFNQTQLDEGRIGYLEVDSNLEGFALEDSVILFSLNFMPKSNLSAVTEISFSEMPLRFSGMDVMNNRIDTITTNGVINLEGTNAVSAFAEDPRFTVSPNPFTRFVRVQTSLNYSGPATLEILDLSGRLLSSRKMNIAARNSTTELQAGDFPGQGAYIIRLITDREQLHRKVILHGRE